MKCFYHNDMDGRCAGALVSYFTGELNKEDFCEVDYNKVLPQDVEKGIVYFVDYSFTETTKPYLDSLINNKKVKVIWIDHHTSSIELEKKYPYLKNIDGKREDSMSGAALTYLYFNPYLELPKFVRLVSDYDCWQFKYSPETEYFKIGIESENNDALDDVWTKLIHENVYKNSLTLPEILKKGKAIKSYIDSTNTYYREHFAYETEIEGYKCLAVNWKTNSWVFGEEVNNYPIVMVYAFDGTYFTYSIFSIDNSVDCSKIAEKFGGGGHRGAAGFKSKELLFRKV